MNVKDMVELRNRLVTEGRALCDKADAEKRQMTDEESARHATILNDSHKLGDQIVASPTICGGRIYLRVIQETDGQRQEMLYCIAKRK